MIQGRPTGPSKTVFLNRYFHPDQSATSQLLTDLTSALSLSGLNVHVICSRLRYDDAQARLPAFESMGGVQVRRIWTTRFGRQRLVGRAVDYATFYASSAWMLLTVLRRGDTLVAETDPPLISIVAMAVARLRGARLVNWLQDVFPEVATELGANPLPRAVDRTVRRCRDTSLRAAGVNVVLGERMRERLVGMGLPAAQIQVVQNWAEVDPAPPIPAAASKLRRALGLTGQFVVGYSGNLGRAHEYATVLGAAEGMRELPDVVFLMIGGGAGMTRLAQEVEARQLGNFRFLAYQARETLGDALAAADVHWVSLRPAMEGLIVPSKLYGILAAARPVVFIGDPDGEVARVIARCGCGGVVAVGDCRELRGMILAWKDDPALREEMGARGHREYLGRYTAQRAFEQWIGILAP